MFALPLKPRPPVDRYTAGVVLVLACVGVVAVYSAIAYLAATKADGVPERLLLKHLASVVVALGLMGAVSRVPYRVAARLARPLLVAALVLLALVPVVGVVSGGAARWIRVGGLGFQPSDLARTALVVYVAVLLAKKQAYIHSFTRGFLPILLWVGLTCGLIGMQNLSTAALLLVTTLTTCFVGRVRVAQMAALAALGLVGAGILLSFSPARAARVESYLGTKLFAHTDSLAVMSRGDEGYQAHQAAIAFAMGGAFGVGPGRSVQRDFLPAPYNDFIFAIVGEEYGLAGALFLLGLFCLLLWRGYLRIARHAPDPVGFFMAVGLTTALVLYGFVHAGVATGLLPVTGLPMPFVSYGGSSLFFSGVMAGLLLSISRESTEVAAKAGEGASLPA